MVRATVVERREYERDEDGKPKDIDWGKFDFVALPRVGESIRLWHGYSYRTVVAQSVLHRAIERPLRNPESEYLEKEPYALLFVSG